jgi:hypothetical protein
MKNRLGYVDRAYEVLFEADLASRVTAEIYELYYVCESSRDLQARLAPLPLTFEQKDALIRAKAKDEIDPKNPEKTAAVLAARRANLSAYEYARASHSPLVSYDAATGSSTTQQE